MPIDLESAKPSGFLTLGQRQHVPNTIVRFSKHSAHNAHTVIRRRLPGSSISLQRSGNIRFNITRTAFCRRYQKYVTKRRHKLIFFTVWRRRRRKSRRQPDDSSSSQRSKITPALDPYFSRFDPASDQTCLFTFWRFNSDASLIKF